MEEERERSSSGCDEGGRHKATVLYIQVCWAVGFGLETDVEEEEPRGKKKAKLTCPTCVSFRRSRPVQREKKENSPAQREKKERRRREGGRTGSRVGLEWKASWLGPEKGKRALGCLFLSIPFFLFF